MANYPGSLDTFATGHQDGINEFIRAAATNDNADALNKVEAKLGIGPSTPIVGSVLTGAAPAGTTTWLAPGANGSFLGYSGGILGWFVPGGVGGGGLGAVVLSGVPSSGQVPTASSATAASWQAPAAATPQFVMPVVTPSRIFTIGAMRYGGDGSALVAIQSNTVHDVIGPMRSVAEFDDKGIIGSIHPAAGQPYDLGSHFEGWLQGDTQPKMRLNSFPSSQLELGPGGSGVTDVIFRRVSPKTGNFVDCAAAVWRTNATDVAFASGRTTEQVYRWQMTADGAMIWGAGAVGGDANLYRSAAAFLKTDQTFIAGAGFQGIMKAGVPNTGDVPVWNTYQVVKNTTSGAVTLAYNDSGVIQTISAGGGLGPVTLTGVPSSGQAPVATGPTTATWQTLGTGGPPSGAATGDLSGSYPAPSVAKINGISITGTPSIGQHPIATSATAATWQTPAAGGPPTGAAGNDLSGSYPNPTVAKINGIAVSGTPSVGQAPIATSATAATWQTLGTGGPPSGAASGDLSGSYPSPSVAKVNGIAITGTPSLGQHPIATSTTAATWQTPPGASGAASGDLSGSYPGPTVAKLNGVLVSGAPISGQVPTATSATVATWQTPVAGAAGGDVDGGVPSTVFLAIQLLDGGPP